jgi:Adenylate and Guanylate cyclase catalytic domain
MKNLPFFFIILGFASLATCIPPTDLVTLLNDAFSRFDDIVDFHHLEKIRTIGYFLSLFLFLFYIYIFITNFCIYFCIYFIHLML